MRKTVIICDRCGQQYEKNSTYKGDILEPQIVYTYRTLRDSEDRVSEEYDLCPYCGRDLSEWLHNRKQKLMLKNEKGDTDAEREKELP